MFDEKGGGVDFIYVWTDVRFCHTNHNVGCAWPGFQK